MRFLICLLTVAMLMPAAVGAANPPADLEARRKALNDLLHERWEYTMRTSPIYASILGDKRYNDKLDDFSQQAIDDDLEQTRRFLDRFEAIDTAGLPEQEALNKQLMIRDLKMALEGARFKPWEMPVNQSSGIHIDAPQLVSVLSFENVKDYEDYITRLKLLPVLFDQTIEQMRKGMAEQNRKQLEPRNVVFVILHILERKNAHQLWRINVNSAGLVYRHLPRLEARTFQSHFQVSHHELFVQRFLLGQ